MKKIYLASPYSDNDSKIQEQRFKAVCKIAGNLIKERYFVFCPIAHSHSIYIHSNLPNKSNFWKRFNESWIDWCDEFWIANMPLWNDSKGIEREIKYAESVGKEIVLSRRYDNKGILLRNSWILE